MANGQDQAYGNGQQGKIPPGNGVTGVHQFRLDSLEKRVETLEQDVKTLLTDTATIKARLDAMPTQANVYWLFAGALIVNFVTLVGHLLIRALSP